VTGLVKSVVIGTAGHIDHGKTALVRALTGIDTDRLPEEKRRGITIDLGFSSLNAIAPDGSPLRISFVDVPGHKLFIRNMLAGTGGIDAVLLVISAEEGVKPQTEEHLAICSLLGIRRGLVAVTKTDAVSSEHLEKTCSDIRTFLSGSFLEESDASILPVSAHTGEGLDTLRRELLALAMTTKARNPDHVPRLPVDRAFVMKGFGTVVTGTLLSAEFHTGESLLLEPGTSHVRVRGMQTHGHAEECASAGSRVALNLAGVEVSEVSRGQTLVTPGTLQATTVVDVEITLLSGALALKHRSRVHFHALTADTLASVSLYSYQPVEPGSCRPMRLKLQKPIVLVSGDRFVLRQSSPAATIGGGRVLDAQPLPNLRKGKCLTWLEALKDASLEEQLFLRIARRGTAGLTVHQLIAETGLMQEALIRIFKPLVQKGRLLRISDDRLLTKEHSAEASETITSRVKPDGLKRSELKNQTALNKEVFDFLLKKLVDEEKIRLRGELVYSSESNGQPMLQDRDALSAIASIYEEAGLLVPSSTEVAVRLGLTGSEMRKLMTLLLREKILVKMGAEELYIHHRALEKLRDEVRKMRGQAFDVARFKQLYGLSRKYAIPLLEYLDRERITRKDGDKRLVL
jgi:selenocysteine-specific elongation factor